jgi:hypothetical protein
MHTDKIIARFEQLLEDIQATQEGTDVEDMPANVRDNFRTHFRWIKNQVEQIMKLFLFDDLPEPEKERVMSKKIVKYEMLDGKNSIILSEKVNEFLGKG